MVASMIGPEQRARLNLAKLRAVVRAHTGATTTQDRPLGGLAAVVVGDDGNVQEGRVQDGFVLVSGPAGLGAAVLWALRQDHPRRLHLIVDTDAEDAPDPDVLARRAGYFRADPWVYRLVGSELTRAQPAAHEPPLVPDPAALVAMEPLRAAGVEVVVEHGVVLAEVLGLEVGRVVKDPVRGFHLEVGVGRYDREAARLMEALRSVEEVTATVLDVVRGHRRPDQPPHLLNRLARQRWLRANILVRPELVGASYLVAMEPPFPRESLIDTTPALASGRRTDGGSVVVACAVGVDAEAIPTAADARHRFDPEAELVYVCPSRDQYRAVRELAQALRQPARMVTLEGEWTS